MARADHTPATPDQNPIELFQPAGPATVIASAADFSSLGSEPGLSDDGQAVAFYGDLTVAGAASFNAVQPGLPALEPGEGIFVSLNTSGQSRILVRVAGISDNGVADPGEVWNNNTETDTGGFKSFLPDVRVGVNLEGSSSAFYRVVFEATAADGTKNGTVGIFSAKGPV